MKPNALLHLNGDQRITSLFVDDISGSIFIGLSDGRIIGANRSLLNSHATGNRSFSASIEDGYGFISQEAFKRVLYICRDAVLRAERTNEVSNIWKTIKPYSANETNEIVGVFTSRPLWAGEDFIFWKDVFWDSNGGENTEATVQVRIASSSGELESKDWLSFNVISGEQSASLDQSASIGAWIQMRVVLKSSTANFSHFINKVGISYRSKYALYFYTMKFSMDRGTNLDSGLLVANMDVPRNTEVKIGVTDTNSNEWNDYQIIDVDRAFKLDKTETERMKVGFKIISHSPDSFAKIDEFAVMVGGEKMKMLKAT